MRSSNGGGDAFRHLPKSFQIVPQPTAVLNNILISIYIVITVFYLIGLTINNYFEHRCFELHYLTDIIIVIIFVLYGGIYLMNIHKDMFF